MIGFLLTSLFVHKSLENFNSTLVISLCFLVQAFATFLIGPSSILKLPNYLTIIISGLLLTGLAGSFTSIGAYTEMYEPYIKINPNCDRDKLSDILSGLYNAGFSLGTIIGPMAGSYITIWTGSFGKCVDIFAFVTILFSLLMMGTSFNKSK